jgi:linoleate 10R-lipoxygenase
VEQLAAINENGRFTKPADNLPEEEAKKAWAKYDEDLFQTGRLYASLSFDLLLPCGTPG